MDPEDVDISDVEGSSILPNTASSAETKKSPSQTSEQDALVSGSALYEPVGGVMQDDGALSKSILVKLGQLLLNSFASMNPPDLEHKLQMTESFVIFSQNLSIDCGPFVNAVKDYFHNLSKLASIDRSKSSRLSCEELSILYDKEKARLDNISCLYNKELAKYEALKNRCQSLEGVAHMEVTLAQVEEQLFYCMIETYEHKGGVDELLKDLVESRNNLEAIDLDMAEAWELEKEREGVSDNAKAALEIANIWLECLEIDLPDVDLC